MALLGSSSGEELTCPEGKNLGSFPFNVAGGPVLVLRMEATQNGSACKKCHWDSQDRPGFCRTGPSGVMDLDPGERCSRRSEQPCSVQLSQEEPATHPLV